jgi:CRP/FNR family cyclic AMP-dependent transcriptional regulator
MITNHLVPSSTMSAPVELLRRVPLLQSLSDAELRTIANLSTRRRVRARETVVQQSEPGNELFVLVSGHLKVISTDPEGRDAGLNVMGPGEVFGEVALLDGGPRSATIVALGEPCELLVIRREHWLRFLKESPDTAVQLLGVLAGRLRKLTERTEDIAFLRVGERLAKTIAALASTYGETQPDGSIRLQLKMSQQEMGDLVGATRESANKQIRAWEQEGLVSQDHGHLIIRDLEKLRGYRES